MSELKRDSEIDINKCIKIDCKGDVVEVEIYEAFNWISGIFRCTKCGCEFTVKVET